MYSRRLLALKSRKKDEREFLPVCPAFAGQRVAMRWPLTGRKAWHVYIGYRKIAKSMYHVLFTNYKIIFVAGGSFVNKHYFSFGSSAY
jgi:hypothetical protein